MRSSTVPGAGLPIAVAVAIAVVDPLSAVRAMSRAGEALDLQLHRTLCRKFHHLAQQIGIGALPQQGVKAHHLIGYRRILVRWRTSNQTLH
jgi:hypothetical protein